ncbi:hypothetical protein hmeg3_12875 [Herbaspirillum sp. meg3]|uniref:DUF7482 domain-containing protein n=1 Tax=Herbaspirillum sp. meg3 TaxID=2025949 RepID=UPI000B987171|nr:hypothetical protein [Herbaspirillum sp. meg3]ASU39090.1 hypothetical protein hmeg3_12875 [Herbaspirillum sp. meg3]
MKKSLFSTVLSSLLLCTGLSTIHAAQAQQTGDIVELPLISGWYDGKVVRYVTTDVSDKKAAAEMGANYVPRLANAINQQRQPGQPGAVERIYSFVNFKQGGVLPSLPSPTGANNENVNYSPLWQVHKVSWLPGKQPRVLKSEEEVLAAEEAGQVSIEKTNLIVNCPVVFSAEGGTLPNIRIHLANQDPEP